MRLFNRFYASRRITSSPYQIDRDFLPIIFHFCKITASQCEIDHPRDTSTYNILERIDLRDRVSKVRPSLNRSTKLRKLIVSVLSNSVRISEDEQSAIIEKVFKVLDDPIDLPIDVYVAEINMHILDGKDDIIERISMLSTQSLDTYIPKLIPATEASTQALKKVRLDSPEIKSIMELSPSCQICMEDLDYSDANDNDTGPEEKGLVDPDHKLPRTVIARMPCLHSFHENCIVRWLKINHWCPVCRYEMPI